MQFALCVTCVPFSVPAPAESTPNVSAGWDEPDNAHLLTLVVILLFLQLRAQQCQVCTMEERRHCWCRSTPSHSREQNMSVPVGRKRAGSG